MWALGVLKAKTVRENQQAAWAVRANMVRRYDTFSHTSSNPSGSQGGAVLAELMNCCVCSRR
jgi:hypothetical protein